jgi:thiol-disulfide isomerase/thioredoxin
MRRNFLVIASVLISSFIFSQEIKSVKITDVEKIIAESKTPLIINMWATWCQPCIEEIPYFISEINKQNSTATTPADSIQLLLVSLDFNFSFPDKIAAFAKKRGITAPIVWLNETNADYFCPKIDAKWSGAIPATLFINNKTGYKGFAEAQLSHKELKEAISKMLDN